MRQFVFKRDPLFSGNDDLILQDFERRLVSVGSNAWLVRESRQQGLITVSFNINDRISHRRLAFISNSWLPIKNLTEAKKLNFCPKQLENMATCAANLLQAIQTIWGLRIRQLQIPSRGMASEVSAYSQYVVQEEESAKLYRDPIGALDKVKAELESKIAFFPESVLAHKEDCQSYREKFLSWLEESEHIDDLRCPISLQIFIDPYRLTSQHVIDKTAYAFNDAGDCLLSSCPITRLNLTTPPRPLIGYHKAFESCLKIFAMCEKLISAQEASSIITVSEANAPLLEEMPRIFPARMFFPVAPAAVTSMIVSPQNGL